MTRAETFPFRRRGGLRSGHLPALLLALVLLLMTGIPTAGAGGVRDIIRNGQKTDTSMPPVYNTVLESYYTLLHDTSYASLSASDLWNMGACPLLAGFSREEKEAFGYCLEDINHDGTPELFMGLSNGESEDTVCQIFTLVNGEGSYVFTTTGENAVYLLEDGLLDYELPLEHGYVMCLYRLESSGSATVTDGVLYDESASGGSFFFITDDSFQAARRTPVSEQRFNEKMDGILRKTRSLDYTPLSRWYEGRSSQGQTQSAGTPSSPKVSADQHDGMYYTLETLTDRTTGARTANVLVPYGWTADLSVDWDTIDITAPGVATVRLLSPDGKAAILITSNYQYCNEFTNSTQKNEGPDLNQYITRLHYRNASEVQSLFLQGAGNAVQVTSYTLPDAFLRMVQDAAQAKLDNITSSAIMLACEGTAADTLYRINDHYTEYITMVTAAAVRTGSSHAVTTMIIWNLPCSWEFHTDSRETHDRYRDVFLTVIANSCFTEEFLYLNRKYGDQIADLVSRNLLSQAQSYLQSQSGAWISDYEKSSGYDSDRLTGGWSDVIKDQNEYTTLEGETVKISTAVDTVYQNGDQFYLGPEGQSPLGWTRLYPN